MDQKVLLNKLPPIVFEGGCEVNMLRLDLFEVDIPGNKYFKMKYNVEAMQKEGHDHLVTFGGAFSNHIAAVAQAGRKYGFKTTGIIRGEKESEVNTTLRKAVENGMNLKFIDRTTYRDWKKGQISLNEFLEFNDYYLLPEGGSNTRAVKGCSEILDLVQNNYDYIACAVGTGATLAGLITSAEKGQIVLGFSSVKGGEYLVEDIQKLLDESQTESDIPVESKWQLFQDYHFGGFAKADKELIDFYFEFREKTNVELDLIYTSKMMFGIRDLIKNGSIESGSKILTIHTGGQQGNASMLERWATKQ